MNFDFPNFRVSDLEKIPKVFKKIRWFAFIPESTDIKTGLFKQVLHKYENSSEPLLIGYLLKDLNRWKVFSYKYHIYSRISREILDKIWHIFLQFDLYAGPKFGPLKHNIFPYLCVLGTSKPFNRKIKSSHFGHFFQLIFPIRLIHGSTYTRVYTVIKFQITKNYWPLLMKQALFFEAAEQTPKSVFAWNQTFISKFDHIKGPLE